MNHTETNDLTQNASSSTENTSQEQTSALTISADSQAFLDLMAKHWQTIQENKQADPGFFNEALAAYAKVDEPVRKLMIEKKIGGPSIAQVDRLMSLLRVFDALSKQTLPRPEDAIASFRHLEHDITNKRLSNEEMQPAMETLGNVYAVTIAQTFHNHFTQANTQQALAHFYELVRIYKAYPFLDMWKDAGFMKCFKLEPILTLVRAFLKKYQDAHMPLAKVPLVITWLENELKQTYQFNNIMGKRETIAFDDFSTEFQVIFVTLAINYIKSPQGSSVQNKRFVHNLTIVLHSLLTRHASTGELLEENYNIQQDFAAQALQESAYSQEELDAARAQAACCAHDEHEHTQPPVAEQPQSEASL